MGEKVYLLKADVGANAITFSIQSCGTCDPKAVDPGHEPYRAEVTFKFIKGALAGTDFNQVKGVIEQVFKTPDDAAPATDAATPQAGAKPQAPAAPLATPEAAPAPPAADPPQQAAEPAKYADIPPPPPPPAAPRKLGKGMTIDEVKAVLGEPESIIDLGGKVIYKYKDYKFTFVGGKVSDIDVVISRDSFHGMVNFQEMGVVMKHFRIHVPVLFGLLGLTAALTAADKPKPATPAPKAPTKAPVGRGATPAAGRGATPGAGRGATSAAGRGATPAAGRGATPGAAGRGATPAAGRGATPGRGGAPAAHGPTNANNRPGGGHVPPGGHEFHGANGNHATFGRDGHPRDVHARGMDIHHGPGGQRTIIRERPGGVRVVSNRYGHGYIGHPYEYRGARFVNRTYYVNGVVYSRFYRPYSWGGVALDVYAPGLYYRPAFYGWAYNPWVTPIAYGGWGWAGNPWYGYYGAWFTPYPVYAGPAYWLTDYLVSQTLAAAYQERASELAAAQANFGAPMPPDVKNLVAEEVRRQLALENAEASGGAAQTPPDPGSSGIARMLTDNQPHIFVAANGLDVTSSNGECFVTEGDAATPRRGGSRTTGEPDGHGEQGPGLCKG